MVYILKQCKQIKMWCVDNTKNIFFKDHRLQSNEQEHIIADSHKLTTWNLTWRQTDFLLMAAVPLDHALLMLDARRRDELPSMPATDPTIVLGNDPAKLTNKLLM